MSLEGLGSRHNQWQKDLDSITEKALKADETAVHITPGYQSSLEQETSQMKLNWKESDWLQMEPSSGQRAAMELMSHLGFVLALFVSVSPFWAMIWVTIAIFSN